MTFLNTLALLTTLFTFNQAKAETPIGQRFKKVVYIVFENKDFGSAMNTPDFTVLTHYGASLTHMMAEVHPSQGNYLAMIGGSAFGVNYDSPVDLTENHLGDLLEAKKLDWKVYAEDYPGNCFTGKSSHYYVRRHVPFMNFTNVSKNSARCAKITDNKNFDLDLKNNSLPAFTMYVPNLLNDAHNTTLSYAGKWLTQKFGATLLDAKDHGDTLYVITFDENEGSGPNQIYTVLIAPSIKPGSTFNGQTSHSGILRMIEDEMSLGSLGRDDATSAPITGIWK